MGFLEQVDFKFRKKNRDLAFTDSVNLLVTDIQSLIGQNAPDPAATHEAEAQKSRNAA